MLISFLVVSKVDVYMRKNVEILKGRLEREKNKCQVTNIKRKQLGKRRKRRKKKTYKKFRNVEQERKRQKTRASK